MLAVSALLSGCANSTDGNAPSSIKEFTFTAPGGQPRIFYDPPDSRGQVRGLAGPDLFDPAKTIGLQDFRGQVVVLNIWGAWCGPCRAEMPDLQLIQEQMAPRGVTVLGIDVRDERAAARDFITSRGITYPSIFDQAGRSLLALDGFPRNTVPSTIVLDRRHRVAAVYLTAIRFSELIAVVQRVAAEQAPTGAAPAGQGPS
ncbi:TlpA family protein disulfide reductase [Pseudonocardia sediminis]|uniref:TlpA family protein disulfide reductase n=1 Tax=Pseudonocardia sediminis TaxID=1397368 RepID=UPI001F5F3C75|nr:TlpA disulfide reductase family protein [Pseudonocardia sediminis]